jgi:hypothetical protein
VSNLDGNEYKGVHRILYDRDTIKHGESKMTALHLSDTEAWQFMIDVAENLIASSCR